MPCNFKTTILKPCKCACKWRCKCLIPQSAKQHPPFNSNVKRFVTSGLYPKNIKESCNAPPVGSYELESHPMVKTTVPNWTTQLETMEYSRTLGGIKKVTIKFAEKLQEKERRKASLGPGSQDIPRWPESFLERPAKSIRRDIGFGIASFQEPKLKSTTPGPGYFLRVHNPYYYLDRNRFKSFTPVPSFEYDGLVPRFKRREKKWSLPCNRYTYKHPQCLEALLTKVTGKRGPYALFTGPRDDSTLKGRLAPPMTYPNVRWPMKLPSEVDKLLHKSNYFKGIFSNCPRFVKAPGVRMMLNDISTCYKDPNHPGPGHYTVTSPKKPRTTKNYPFDTNLEHVRPLPPDIISPGPGMYRIKKRDCIEGHGWTCVFKSKVPRTMGALLPKKMNSF